MKVEQIGFLYEYFYCKIFDLSFRYTPSEKIDKSIEKFLLLIKKQYPTSSWNTLWSYFVFQFQMWEAKGIENYNKRVNYNNIIGSQPFKRYKERNQDYDWINRESSLIKKYKLSIEEFKRKYGVKEVINGSNIDKTKEENIVTTTTTIRVTSSIESAIRAQNLNTEGGFLDCIELTTLHDPQDKSCNTCIFMQDCIEIQKKNLPRIYNNRNK